MMAFTHPHPRRRSSNTPMSLPSLSPTSSYDALSSPTSSLRKSSTFNSPTTPPCSDTDPILNIPSLPRRSPTCPKGLEDAVAAGDRRIAELLGAIDRDIAGVGEPVTDSQATIVAEASPVPRFMLNAEGIDSDPMDIDHATAARQAHPSYHEMRPKHHPSDSGIGSSSSSSLHYAGFKAANSRMERAKMSPRMNHSTPIGINGMAASGGVASYPSQHALSEHACRQIQKYIIVPIMKDEKLQSFHPLVHRIPYLVARKEIICLRDLEKLLLTLAPRFSASKSAFFTFCNTTIQALHTTVPHLSKQDQQRPADRPYTNGYFLDLVEQVRQYAAIVAAQRARQNTHESENTEDEHLTLVGGLSQTGRPAELVRRRDGKSVSLRTGEVVTEDDLAYRGLKRCASDDSDEDPERSMARRRKNMPPPVKEVQKCRECSKIFKRPCDLTKHEKTHSRPWKCSETNCKYHDLGWPTEKERDRHMNDKHSAEPPKYRCQFHPCPYESKRESNCKQHMEKAHGWEYVRSKNNGKGPRTSVGKTPPTPAMSTPGSLIFTAQSPDFGTPVSFEQDLSHSRHGSVGGSVVASDFSGSYLNNNDNNFADFLSINEPFTVPAWGDSANPFGTENVDELLSTLQQPLEGFDPSMGRQTLQAPIDTTYNPEDEDPLFGDNFDWSNMDPSTNNFTMMNLQPQLMTPAASAESRVFDTFSRNPSVTFEGYPKVDPKPLSPGAQGDAMLYSPYSVHDHDETFGDYPVEPHKPQHDFALFGDSNVGSSAPSTASESMFQDLSSFNVSSGWSGRGADIERQFGYTMPMEE